jgi:hypothetical protein
MQVCDRKMSDELCKLNELVKWVVFGRRRSSSSEIYVSRFKIIVGTRQGALTIIKTKLFKD